MKVSGWKKSAEELQLQAKALGLERWEMPFSSPICTACNPAVKAYLFDSKGLVYDCGCLCRDPEWPRFVGTCWRSIAGTYSGTVSNIFETTPHEVISDIIIFWGFASKINKTGGNNGKKI